MAILSDADRERFRSAGQLIEIWDYPYRPRPREWHNPKWIERIKCGAPQYADQLARFAAFNDDFRRIPVLPEHASGATCPYWENSWLPGLDAVAIYGLIATLKPPRYIEIGSGNSTRFAHRAITEHSPDTRLISIGPGPTAQIDSICDECIRDPLEEISLSIFSSMREGEILFIDNSHRSFQNSDVTIFFTEILPLLSGGVIYGIHDIFLPWDYPQEWKDRFYNEQYLLMSYLIGGGDGDSVLFPTHYVSRADAFAAQRNAFFVGSRHLDHLAGSFWMVRGT